MSRQYIIIRTTVRVTVCVAAAFLGACAILTLDAIVNNL